MASFQDNLDKLVQEYPSAAAGDDGGGGGDSWKSEMRKAPVESQSTYQQYRWNALPVTKTTVSEYSRHKSQKKTSDKVSVRPQTSVKAADHKEFL